MLLLSWISLPAANHRALLRPAAFPSSGAPMFSLVYASSAVKPFSKSELVELLAPSREKNRRLGITGMLLYKDGNFMQALEGEESAVRKLYAAISADPRHRIWYQFYAGHTASRNFAGWSMGFNDLNSPEVHGVSGYDEFMNLPLTGQEFASDPSRCERLLLIFKGAL
jgi:hypothetical protein